MVSPTIGDLRGHHSHQGKTMEANVQGSTSGILNKLVSLLPCSGCHMGVEIQRQTLMDNTRQIQRHFSQLLADNWSPDRHEFIYDDTLLPIMAKAENSRISGANIRHYEDFEDLFNQPHAADEQALVSLPGKESKHKVAIDIKEVGNILSLIMVESLSSNWENNELVGVLSEKMPDNAKMIILSTGVLKGENGCRIFALSAAAKMAKGRDYFNALHEAMQQGAPEIANVSGSVLKASEGKVSLFDAHRSMPTALIKHSQSRSLLNRWGGDKEGPVNKQGQTVLQRFDQYQTTRYQWDIRSMPPKVRPLTFSTSIEHKRLQYLDRTLAYLATAPAKEIKTLAADFDRRVAAAKMPEQVGLQLDNRRVGPEKVMLDRQNEMTAKFNRFRIGGAQQN